MTSFDFVAVGDTVIDAFIRLQVAETHVLHGSKQLCVRFGDKIPYEFVEVVPAVGNAANAAVSAARLGLSSAFVANVGKDKHGEEISAALFANGVATDFLKFHDGKETNYHYVLWYKEERTILIKHETYDYALPDIGGPTWVYLSSVAENALAFHDEISAYLEKHPNIKLAFQPGTYQMKFGYERMKAIYKRADLFFCNTDEARRILETEETDIGKLLKAMYERGPKIVSITDGPLGAYAYDGHDAWKMPMYPDPKPPYERTGAGDAYSSTFTVALALGKSVEEALMWGPINSMSVVQSIGAQKGLLKREDLEQLLAKAPKNYRPEKFKV